MPKSRTLMLLAVVLASVAAAAQTQPPQKSNKRSVSSGTQNSSTPNAAPSPGKGMTVPANAPQPDTPNGAAAAATAQATNPYYGTPTSANPQNGGACGSGGPNDTLAACQQQMGWLIHQRNLLLGDQRGTQQRITSLRSSGSAANDGQIAQMQTHLDGVTQQISTIDARMASVRDRIAQLGGGPATPAPASKAVKH